MLTLRDIHLQHGAILAADGIPLHYADRQRELETAYQRAVIMDRSHETRLRLTGKDRLIFVDRMSTNLIKNMQPGEGRATIFTNANARILERAEVFARSDDLLLLGEPGHARLFSQYLARNIFFGDQCRIEDISTSTAQFGIYGPNAAATLRGLGLQAELREPGIAELASSAIPLTVIRRKSLLHGYWAIICPAEHAASVYQELLRSGATFGLEPAGSLTYHALRIQAGRPAERELSTEYLPLEVGLWDEVSFQKGCYTGQEIIARMESREKLARTIVALEPDAAVNVPAELVDETGRAAGELTSLAELPSGQVIALGVVRIEYAEAGTILKTGDVSARVIRLVGAQAPYISRLKPNT